MTVGREAPLCLFYYLFTRKFTVYPSHFKVEYAGWFIAIHHNDRMNISRFY